MARYIDEEKLIEALKIHFDALYREDGELLASDHMCIGEDVGDLIKLVNEQPKADVVSKIAFELVKWERDLAIKQLESYGVGFCEDKELVEVKRGEWIEDGYNDIPCVCSYCGSEAPYKADCRECYDYDYDDDLIFTGAEIEKEYIKAPYCPNCGADMRSNKNESEADK